MWWGTQGSMRRSSNIGVDVYMHMDRGMTNGRGLVLEKMTTLLGSERTLNEEWSTGWDME